MITINIHLGDCIDAMKGMKENRYQLCICDPPYGLNMAKEKPRKDGRFSHNKPREWDEKIPDDKFFNEVFRIAQDQIIWGGNYFPLPPHKNFIFWYKQNPVPNFSDGELAWTSFDYPAKCFDYRYYGNLSGKTSAEKRLHISQKPVALYKWLLKNYGFNKDGSKRTIFDSHGGSLSIVIACIDMGFDIDIWEIDLDYYRDGVNRVKRHLDQLDLTREQVEINYK